MRIFKKIYDHWFECVYTNPSTGETSAKNELERMTESIRPPKDLMSGKLCRLYSMSAALGYKINYGASPGSCAYIEQLKIYNVSYSYMLSIIDGDAEYLLWDYYTGWTNNVAESDREKITSYLATLVTKMEEEVDALDRKRQNRAHDAIRRLIA